MSTSKHKGGQQPMRNSLSCLNWSKSRLLRSHPAPTTYFHPLPSANASVYRSRWWCASSRQKKPRTTHHFGGRVFNLINSMNWFKELHSISISAEEGDRNTNSLELRVVQASMELKPNKELEALKFILSCTNPFIHWSNLKLQMEVDFFPLLSLSAFKIHVVLLVRSLLH